MKRLRDIAIVLMIFDLLMVILQIENINLVTDHIISSRLLVVLTIRTVTMFVLTGIVITSASKHIHEGNCAE